MFSNEEHNQCFSQNTTFSKSGTIDEHLVRHHVGVIRVDIGVISFNVSMIVVRLDPSKS